MKMLRLILLTSIGSMAVALTNEDGLEVCKNKRCVEDWNVDLWMPSKNIGPLKGCANPDEDSAGPWCSYKKDFSPGGATSWSYCRPEYCFPEGIETQRCDQEYTLDGRQIKKMEFILKPHINTEKACKFTVNIADGFHGVVKCIPTVKGFVKINSRVTKSYNGTGPVRIEWLAVEGKDRKYGKMYCDVGMLELLEEIKLKGKNGIEASVKDIEEAYGLKFENIDIPKEELAANLEDSKAAMLAVNKNPDRTWTASIGKLSIFSPDYVAETMTGFSEPPTDQLAEDTDRMERQVFAPMREDRAAVPENIDLSSSGAVSPPKNQGQCGSCAAFAATSTIETCIYNANGKVMHGDLSEQNLMDCGFGYSVNSGCDGGNVEMYIRFLKDKYVGMLADEKDYRYQMADRKCLPINAKNTGALVTDYYASNKVKEDEVMALVAAGNQVATAVSVVGDFNNYNGKGIFESIQCCNYAGEDGYVDHEKIRKLGRKCNINHAVTIVGYGIENGVKYWKIKNSWGQDWGGKGFMKIIRGKKHCGITSYVSMPKCSAGSPKPVPVVPVPPYPITERPPATCGGDLTEDSGLILSENYPDPYPVPDTWERYCEWNIGKKDQNRDQEDMVLKLTIKDFSLAGTCPYCRGTDWIQIFNGDDTGISLGSDNPGRYGKICGDMQSVPVAPIYTKGPSAKLRFKTIKYRTPKTSGFKIKYEYVRKPNCQNQKIQIGSASEKKFFTTPDYPVSYQKSSVCDWTVTAPKGFSVALQFEDYQVSSYGSAHQDVTVAYDGEDKDAKQLLKIKGRKEGVDKPGLVVASGNTIHLTFHSNSKATNKGFKVKAYALAKCDYNIDLEELYEATSTISSFGYPENYPPSLKCTWTITAKKDEVVKFELDKGDMNLFRDYVWDDEASRWEMTYDKLKIWDGLDTSGEPDVTLNKDWNYWGGLIHFSKGQTLSVVFAPGANSAKGFTATVSSLTSFKNQKIQIEKGKSVAITSPHFGGHNIKEFYMKNEEADWTLTAPSGSMVRLEITDFEQTKELGAATGLYLYKGLPPPQKDNLLDTIGEDGSSRIVYSPTNQMMAVFKMASGKKKGFKATVSEIPSCAGKKITLAGGEKQVIASINENGKYIGHQNCDWTISVPEGYTVNLEADALDIRPTIDKLAIYDGPSDKATLIEEFGVGLSLIKELPKALGSDSTMHIAFFAESQYARGWYYDKIKNNWPHGEVPITGKGFSATVTAVKSTANQKLVLNALGKSVTFSTFKYPENYPSTLKSDWTISSPADTKVRLTFDANDEFDVYGSELNIYGDKDQPEPTKQIKWSKRMPNPLESSWNWIKLEFDANQRSRAGFKATATAIPAGCGKKIALTSVATQQIQSPVGADGKYDNNEKCDWIISSSSNTKIRIEFSSFDTEQGYDHVIVDGTKYDGKKAPGFNLVSEGNKMIVQFRSDSSQTRTGFVAKVTIV